MTETAKAAVSSLSQLFASIPRHLARERIDAIIRAYLGHDYADAAGRAAYYAADGQIEDPAGLPPVRGSEAIRGVFERTVDAGLRSELSAEEIIISGDEAVAAVRATVSRGGTLIARVRLILCFALDGDGKFIRVRAFFDERSVEEAV